MERHGQKQAMDGRVPYINRVDFRLIFDSLTFRRWRKNGDV